MQSPAGLPGSSSLQGLRTGRAAACQAHIRPHTRPTAHFRDRVMLLPRQQGTPHQHSFDSQGMQLLAHSGRGSGSHSPGLTSCSCASSVTFTAARAAFSCGASVVAARWLSAVTAVASGALPSPLTGQATSSSAAAADRPSSCSTGSAGSWASRCRLGPGQVGGGSVGHRP